MTDRQLTHWDHSQKPAKLWCGYWRCGGWILSWERSKAMA